MLIARSLKLYGIIQGVGFRPFVSRLAKSRGIAGEVTNQGALVTIIAYGAPEAIADFFHSIKNNPPPRAMIVHAEEGTIAVPETLPDEFIIKDSELIDVGISYLSPDIGICDNCVQEMITPNNRRYLHPFINCTDCGPRLTIINTLPYDRERTVMEKFPLCSDCLKEYHKVEDRRYDAQPIACPACGPHYYILSTQYEPTPLTGTDAIKHTRHIINGGGIAAVKGIGGFHLVADAANPSAVKKLRERKYRPYKPLAVMAKNIAVAEREAILSNAARELLTSWQRPIVILPKNNLKSTPRIDELVAPTTHNIGLLLPYAPIHQLLFDYHNDIELSDVLVMTSGNPSGAPICINDEEAAFYLTDIADIILSHNRDILIRADDSVLMLYRDKPYMIRRSRGYAPLPLAVTSDRQSNTKVSIAIGADQKNTFALTNTTPNFPALIYPAPHIGDLGDIRSHNALLAALKHLKKVLNINPQRVIADKHPSYHSRTLAEKLNLPTTYVQHHHAHILACMADNDYFDPIIGIALDGTGYGEDGNIWGGELLYVTTNNAIRLKKISPFYQLGGDNSTREPWRIAISLLYEIKDILSAEFTALVTDLKLASSADVQNNHTLLQHKTGGILSTSAGRLFDGVSAILGICKHSTYEGEAAVRLEYNACEWLRNNNSSPTEDILGHNARTTNYMIRYIVERLLAGEDPDKLAYEFHELLAHFWANEAVIACSENSLNTVALSGGVFQNLLFLDLLTTKLEDKGLTVLHHHLIPPNDGGIAVGQAIYGLYNE